VKREIPRVQSGLNQLQNVVVILVFNCLSMFCNIKEVNEGRLCHVDPLKADKSCAICGHQLFSEKKARGQLTTLNFIASDLLSSRIQKVKTVSSC
jgi:hypothetical protein